CGCCTVIVDGRAVVSCAVPARSVAGEKGLTLEGFSEFGGENFSDNFFSAGGFQGGFCTPGNVVCAKNIIVKSPDPSDDQINRILSMHHCRCTGYVKIVDSIKLAARAMRGEGVIESDGKAGRIGTGTARYEAREFTLGDKPYIDDMSFPGMLY